MVTNGNITGFVEGMDQDGLASRVRLEEDRRVAVATLTDWGRNLFKAMAEAHEGWLKEMVGMSIRSS